MESADFGLGAAPQVAALMARCLGWDDARVNEELSTYRAFVDGQRTAMEFPDDESANAVMTSMTMA
jgi:glycerol-3-phosphate dehydrogenase